MDRPFPDGPAADHDAPRTAHDADPPATRRAPLAARSTDAVVLERTGEGVRCAAGDTVVIATPAASCLLAPEAGDRVLLARLEGGEAFVLAVLTRGASAPATLSVSGAETVRIATPELSLVARTMRARADTVEVDVNEAAVRAARRARVFAAAVEVAAVTLSTTAETLMEKAGHAIRRIRGVERVRAGSRIETVEAGLVVRAGDGSITAKKNLRLDAEQITAG